MPSGYHTIILGLGAMGSAAAAHLARRLGPSGQKILGFEQFDIPHALGSSHGQSRLIRLAYYEHPDYVPLLRRAYELWRDLEQATGAKLLHITGGLYVAPPDHELITGCLQSARTHHLAHELLSSAQIRTRFPSFQPPPDAVGFFEADAGFLLPEKAVCAHAELALRHGAELHPREPALDWSSSPSGITVRTAQNIYHAQRLLITAGPWTSRLLPQLAPALRVTRQPMLWFWPRDPDAFTFGRFPCWCAAAEAGGIVYGPPMLPHDSPLGLKVSHHFPGQAADPDTVHRDPLPGDADAVRATLGTLLPGANGPLLSQRICLYTNTPDHHFLIDRHPNRENVFFAGGFSGHGFKFASVIGEILADLAIDGRTSHPIAFLGRSRLRG